MIALNSLILHSIPVIALNSLILYSTHMIALPKLRSGSTTIRSLLGSVSQFPPHKDLEFYWTWSVGSGLRQSHPPRGLVVASEWDYQYSRDCRSRTSRRERGIIIWECLGWMAIWNTKTSRAVIHSTWPHDEGLDPAHCGDAHRQRIDQAKFGIDVG